MKNQGERHNSANKKQRKGEKHILMAQTVLVRKKIKKREF
jgi:hypothetical protein